ncbi:DEAD/DEAH box helicase [uncultured Amnibacterium sp.]|uniref:DEAD/DEAH box helicase n=1 Tax=uncultured Amnibacterium sp. TaxID=1631851 RepID=UPI0035CC4FAE
MPARPRNNPQPHGRDGAARRPGTGGRGPRTPDGAKRRWTPEEREQRAGSAARPERPSRPGRSASSDGNRAARREDRFGQQDERGAGRPSRRTDWSPGPRTGGKRNDSTSGDRGGRSGGGRLDRADRPQRDDRGDRPQRPERPQRSNGFNRTGRPETASRFDRSDRTDRGDRPQSQGRFERPDRAERPKRYESSERPERSDRSDRAQRFERPERSDHPQRDGRSERFDRAERPQRDDRTDRSDRPQRFGRTERVDRPQRDERPRSGGRPDFADRPRADHRPAQRRDRDQAPRESRFFGQEPRTERFQAPEDVVLEHLAGEVVTPAQVAGTTFAGLGLGEQITKALAELGATEPFPIQAATIPHALAGRNVLGRGRTGSGKTIAFGAALVERLLRNWADSGRTGSGRRVGRPPRALVLAPTRELALQIDRTIQPIARAVGLYTTQIVGGVPQARQTGALAKGVDIVIGTPGRIEDLLEQRRLDLSAIEIAVLDEADHMADLGFLEPMQRLLRRVPASGQRMLFSATLDSAVSQLVAEFLPDPAVHEVADPEGSGTADHRVLVIDQGAKIPVLAALVGAAERSLVFARTRAFAEQLADDLDAEGVRTESLHGDLNQARRTRNLARFSEGKVSALVATDVAARGIHVDDIDLVVHADSAEDYKTYLHRSGRTGRAGASGTVVTLITARRRRRFTELLERAGIDADFVVLHAGDDPVAALGR